MKGSFKIKKLNKKGIILIILVLCLVIGVGNTVFNYENRVAYETKYYEKTEAVTIKQISKEKGKEAVYTIGTFWGEVDIPESIYLEYIGDENNAITLRFEKLSVYVASAKFGLSFDKSDERILMRISYPWEDDPQKFSNGEIQEVIKAIKKTVQPFDMLSGNTYNEWRELNFSFEFNKSLHSVHFSNCLEEGATKYKMEKSTTHHL